MMAWQYLAGFFDGEGCVNYATRGQRSYTIRLTFSQAFPRGYVLLKKIKQFLEEEGCHLGKIHTSGRVKDPEKQGWQIQISERDSTKKIMEAMLPFLEIKKLEVQDALRRQKLYPPVLGRLKGGAYN